MSHRRRNGLIAAAVLAGIALAVLATSGPQAPAVNPPGSFAFAVLGDAPYNPWEDLRYPLVLQDIAAHDLAFVVHVGDIFWGPCSDARYRRSLDWFQTLPQPVLYTPGDNEWADCFKRVAGRGAPRERLDRIRQIFFSEPRKSLGARTLELEIQGGAPPFSEFVENARWSHEGLVFATIHLVGSANGLEPWSGRDAADDAEVVRRTEAAAAWLRATFEEARRSSAPAVVVFFHANPAFEAGPDDPYRKAYEPFLTALEEEVERFPGPVLAVHGDQHVYLVDRPLLRRTTGERLPRFTRAQVPGSPTLGWVRVVVTPGADPPFAVEARVVPRFRLR